MTIPYTREMKFPLQEDGGYNWGSIINGVIDLLDKGFELTFEAGEAISAGDVLALKTADGKIYQALATDSTLTPAIGIAPNDISSGSEGKVRRFGWCDIGTSYSTGGEVSFSPGEFGYVGAVAGRLSKTRQSWSNCIGWSKSWTDADYITHFCIEPVKPVDLLVEALEVEKQAAYASEIDNGNSGAAATIDWGEGNKQGILLTDDCVFTFTAPQGPASLILRLIQDATGSRTVTWPATVKWASGAAPTLTTDAFAVDLVCLYWDGNNYYGSSILDMQ